MLYRDLCNWLDALGRISRPTPRRGRRAALRVEPMEARALLSSASIAATAAPGLRVEDPNQVRLVAGHTDPNQVKRVATYEDPNQIKRIAGVEDPNEVRQSADYEDPNLRLPTRSIEDPNLSLPIRASKIRTSRCRSGASKIRTYDFIMASPARRWAGDAEHGRPRSIPLDHGNITGSSPRSNRPGLAILTRSTASATTGRHERGPRRSGRMHRLPPSQRVRPVREDGIDRGDRLPLAGCERVIHHTVARPDCHGLLVPARSGGPRSSPSRGSHSPSRHCRQRVPARWRFGLASSDGTTAQEDLPAARS